MSIRPTLQLGDPLLKAPNKAITDVNDPEVITAITDLRDTMYENGLIGMAAPQIGINLQLYITHPRQTDTRPTDQADEFRVYINPKIIDQSPEDILIWEGCGSVVNAKLFGPVIRPKVITVEALDQQGKSFQFTSDGILGRVIQHEQDHLIGVEFTEKVTDYKLLKDITHYKSQIKNTPEQLAAQKITVKKYNKL